MRPRMFLTVVVCLGALGALPACGTTGGEAGSARAPQGDKEVTTPETPTASEKAQEDANSSMRSETEDRSAAVLPRVQTYSDAFLDGHPTKAYALLSRRCHREVSLSHFTGIVMAAKQVYGRALEIKTSEIAVRDDVAIVSYTYDVPALNQKDEKWVREHGTWHNDDC